MIRQGWLIGFSAVAFILSGCAKEKEKVSGWASFPVAIYSDPAITASPEGRADFHTAMSFWESNAGRKLFDYQGDWNGGAPYTGVAENPSGILANVVFFLNPWPFPANTAGMTTIVSTSDRGFHGAIIMLNPAIPVCSGDCRGETFRTSKQQLLAHELGHFIGLSHSQDPGDIMFHTLEPGGSLSRSGVNRAALGQVVR